MEPYIDDTFYRLTGLNLRLTVGSDGFQGRVRKRISRRLNLQTDYLQGFQGNSRWTDAGRRLAGRLPDARRAAGADPDVGAQLGVPETLPVERQSGVAPGLRDPQ